MASTMTTSIGIQTAYSRSIRPYKKEQGRNLFSLGNPSNSKLRQTNDAEAEVVVAV